MALRPLDVIWTQDDLIRPPGPKMVVCLAPTEGLFARINTEGRRSGSVPIKRKEHEFLHHDSHIECGAVFEMDDYIVEQSLERGSGVIGCVRRSLAEAILKAIEAAPTIREADKAAIKASLGL